jgi:uncharacterized protein YaiL (DUF2058 family)
VFSVFSVFSVSSPAVYRTDSQDICGVREGHWVGAASVAAVREPDGDVQQLEHMSGGSGGDMSSPAFDLRRSCVCYRSVRAARRGGRTSPCVCALPSLPFRSSAMSFRDALLKAGKVSKKQAQSASTQARKQRKQQKGHVLEAEAEAKRDVIFEKARAEQAEANRIAAEAKRAERERQELLVRMRNLMRSWERKPDPRRATIAFHFVRSSLSIGRIMVDRSSATELEYGALAIVEHPESGEPHLIARDGVTKLMELVGERLRFYTGPEAPDDELVRPPKRPERLDPRHLS